MTKYIITDPCYIISDQVWSECCNEAFDKPLNDSQDKYEKFDQLVTNELNKLAGTTNAKAGRTGFGDWSNCMHSSNDDKIIQSDFFADSGMVCIVEYNDAIKAALEANDNSHLVNEDVGGAALIETEGNVEITINTENPDWTVVEIEDDNDAFGSCLPYEDEEDEESYDWEEEEEDYEE